jgi:hypothetical protein
MLFADALPVLQDALLLTYGDSSAIYRAIANNDRIPITAIIRPMTGDDATTRALIAQNGIPITPVKGDVIEHGGFTYAVSDVQFDETFWILAIRMRGRIA